MVAGGGKIVFAHIEETLDFKTIEGIKKFVEEYKEKDIFYLCYPTDGNQHEVSHFFDEKKHIYNTGNEERPYSITIWLPYKDYYMGC